MKQKLKRYAPLLALLSLAFIGYESRLYEYLTFESLKEHRQELQSFVMSNVVIASISFVVVYAVAVALSVPGATILTVSGGLLFGALLGGALAVVAATIGATVIFLVAKTVVGESLRNRAGPFLKAMEEGFRANAISYLLFLRLVPAFPFWVVNLVPGIAGVPLRIFVLATAVGIIPGTFVFAAFGAGLGEVFDKGEDVSLAGVMSPTLIAALLGLGVLALLPVLIKKFRKP